MSAPFGVWAPKYWEAGIPVLPVQPGTKQPASGISNWPSYINIPKLETRHAWIARYGQCGIALLTGFRIADAYQICALDIDDPAFERLVHAVIGVSPCAKRGARGIT